MTNDEFTKLVNDHDLTYMYSDDGSCFRRGTAEKDAIVAASITFDQDFVRETWNAMVDRRMAEGYREQFYWRK